MPLQSVLESKPFAKWGLDFVGIINPNSSNGHQFILMITDYCTRWTKAQARKNATSKVVIHFLKEFIVTRFKVPYSLMCDNGPRFISHKLSEWAYDHRILIRYSSNYYPQGNGVAKSTNKNLLIVIKKLLDQNLKDWHNKLKYALWSNQIKLKKSMGTSPFQLVYEAEPIFPIHLKIATLQFIKNYMDINDEMKPRMV